MQVVSHHWLHPIDGGDDDDGALAFVVVPKSLSVVVVALIHAEISTGKCAGPNWRILSKPPLRPAESG